MADSGPWDDSDRHEIPRSSRKQRRSLRMSHLDRSPRRHGVRFKDEKLQDMTSSLKASSEVLSTADRMLDHYRSINEDQDDEIRRLRSELDSSAALMQDRRDQQQNRGQVRFADQPSTEVSDDLNMSVKGLETEQRRLTDEINRDRDERARVDAHNQRTIRRLEDSFQRVEDDICGSSADRRQKVQDDVSRRRKASRKDVDEKDVLSESMKMTLEKEQEIRELRNQLRESQRKQSQDQELETKVRKIYDQERSASKEKKQVGKLLEELKNVKDIMSETASDKKERENQRRKTKSAEDDIERSDRDKRLFNKIETLEDKLEDTEHGKRKIEEDLGSVVKRLGRAEDGRNDLLRQMEELNKELKTTNDERTFISSKFRNCEAKLEESEVLRDRLTTRLDTLCKKYENEDDERDSLAQKVERLTERLHGKSRELDDKSRELADQMDRTKQQENVVKECETKKEELKNRALETIKDYKMKFKKSEKDAEKYKSDTEELKEELRKVRRHTDEGSSRCLSLEKELRDLANDREHLKEELERRSKVVDSEVKDSTKRLSAALDENIHLEKILSSMKEETKRLTERNAITGAKHEAEIMRLNQELLEHKEGIRDMFGKKSRLEIKLKEEQSLREELLSSLTEAKEEQAKAKDEVASLYRQLQQERDECNGSLKDIKEKMQKLREQSADELKEAEKKIQKKEDEFEENFGDIKLQLADEKSTVKALRKQQEKDRLEIENIRSELNRVKEERNHLKKTQDNMLQEDDTKSEMRERDKTRISELEAEVKRCHRSLNRVTDEQKDGFQKVNEAIEELIEKFCQENSLSRPSTLSSKSFVDAENWASEATAKLKWLEDDMKERLQTEHSYKGQLNTYRDKVKGALNKADTDKAYLMSELEKQNALLEEMAQQKKELEMGADENQNIITMLQKKIEKLTKCLDTSTKALDKIFSALEDKQKVLDEFDSLRGDQEERDRIRNKYARYQERIGLLKRELTDAKTAAQDLKQDTKDASNRSARLLESLNQLSSPGLPEKHGKDNLTSFLSRSKQREVFASLDSLSSSSQGSLKEDHNFKTPEKVTVRDHKRRPSSIKLTRKHARDKSDQD